VIATVVRVAGAGRVELDTVVGRWLADWHGPAAVPGQRFGIELDVAGSVELMEGGGGGGIRELADGRVHIEAVVEQVDLIEDLVILRVGPSLMTVASRTPCRAGARVTLVVPALEAWDTDL
jgi:hypothetical protein